MKQPGLFPDHPDTQPEPMVSDRQMVALIEAMSQIVKAFFARARAGASDAESPPNDPRPPGETGPGVRAAIHPHTGLHKQESQRLHYALVERARALGWHQTR
jgi:hypothetical protein